MSLTLPFPSAIACADALEQVSSVILLAPSVSNSIGCPGVLIIASVSGGTGDAPIAFTQTSTVHHHPALVGLFPGLAHDVGSPSSIIKTFLSYGFTGPFSFSIPQTQTL